MYLSLMILFYIMCIRRPLPVLYIPHAAFPLRQPESVLRAEHASAKRSGVQGGAQRGCAAAAGADVGVCGAGAVHARLVSV